MPSAHRRPNGSLLGIVAALGGGCAAPGTAPDAENHPDLVRSSVEDGLEREVSYLRHRAAEGPRVVFIHGTPGDSGSLARYVANPNAVMPDGETIPYDGLSIDRPGWGRTAPRRSVPSLADQAAALQPFLEQRAGAGTVLVGHSLGGPIALWTAAQHPDRVGAVVVLAGSVDPNLERPLFIQHVGDFFLFPALLPRWVRTLNRETLPLRAELESLEDRLADVQCPVIIVHGACDRLVPYENVPYMRARLAHNPDVEVVTLEDARHFIPWTHEEVVRAAIGRALARASANVEVREVHLAH